MANQPQPAAVDSQLHKTPDYLQWDDLPDGVLTDGKTVELVLKISDTSRWRLEKAGQLIGRKVGFSKRYRVGDVRKLLDGAEVTAS